MDEHQEDVEDAARLRFRQSTSHMGMPRLPIDDIAGLLATLEGEEDGWTPRPT